MSLTVLRFDGYGQQLRLAGGSDVWLVSKWSPRIIQRTAQYNF